MILVQAPRLVRGLSWGALAAVGLALTPPPASRGQAPTPPAGPASKAAAPGEKAKDDKAKDENAKDDKDDAEEKDATVAPKEERFVDPRAKATMAIFNPIVPRMARPTPADVSSIQNMASGGENFNLDRIKNYVEYFATELTNKNNINAIIKPPDNLPAKDARGLERATDALIRPLIDARFNKNASFLTAYSRLLFESSLPKLVDGNYYTRISAMIVLGTAGSTSREGLDLYNKVLKDKDQVIWVKEWAARGLTNAAQEGRISLETSRAQLAADALVTFLNSDPDLPYFARFRTLEALGAVRTAVVDRPNLKLDAASAIAAYLDNPTARVETRSYAAWALGMLRVPNQVAPYNYALIGHDVGRLAVDLGTKIVAEYDEHADRFDDQGKAQAASLTSLLMFQVVPSLVGEDDISDSGILRSAHPSLAAAKPTLAKIDERIRLVARDAYELMQTGGTTQKKERDELAAKVADLRAFLDANKPKDRHLVPDGPILPDPATAP